MQWSPPSLVLKIYVGARSDEFFHRMQIAIARGIVEFRTTLTI